MTSFFGQVSLPQHIPDNINSEDLSWQGACQAIEDATELANALQEYFSVPFSDENRVEQVSQRGPSSLEHVLSAYSDKRGERAKALVSFSSNYAKVHTANLPYGMGPLVRKLIYAYLPEWGWMLGLKWLYGYQPTVKHVSNHSEHCFHTQRHN